MRISAPICRWAITPLLISLRTNNYKTALSQVSECQAATIIFLCSVVGSFSFGDFIPKPGDVSIFNHVFFFFLFFYSIFLDQHGSAPKPSAWTQVVFTASALVELLSAHLGFDEDRGEQLRPFSFFFPAVWRSQLFQSQAAQLLLEPVLTRKFVLFSELVWNPRPGGLRGWLWP